MNKTRSKRRLPNVGQESTAPLLRTTLQRSRSELDHEEFIDFFRNMRAIPLSSTRRKIMEFKDDTKGDDIQQYKAPVESSTAVEDTLQTQHKKKYKPPLDVKLRKLTAQRYKELQHDLFVRGDTSTLAAGSVDPLSPRSLILHECLTYPMIPFAIKELLVDSYTKSKRLHIESGILSNIEIQNDHIISIDIHDFSMGDEKGLILSKALCCCPYIQCLNISGNRLTDVSAMPILSAVFSSLQCVSLNISNNKLDSDSIDVLKQSTSLLFTLSPKCLS